MADRRVTSVARASHPYLGPLSPLPPRAHASALPLFIARSTRHHRHPRLLLAWKGFPRSSMSKAEAEEDDDEEEEEEEEVVDVEEEIAPS
jgi:hypothetical protein